MIVEELYSILLDDNPSKKIIKNEDRIFKLIPELGRCKGFNQNNEWHIYDVYEHILHVVDNVPADIVLKVRTTSGDISVD